MLSKPDILKRIQEKSITFDPDIEDKQVAQVSIDLRLGYKFTTFKDTPPRYLSEGVIIDPSIFESQDIWEDQEGDTFRLEPDAFVLAQTLETISLPNDLAGMVEGRSTYARLGVSIHVTAPKIDPGFSGPITLEMKNFGNLTIILRSKIDKPAQIIFFQISEALPVAEVYGARESDIYQYQTDPIPRRPKQH